MSDVGSFESTANTETRDLDTNRLLGGMYFPPLSPFEDPYVPSKICQDVAIPPLIPWGSSNSRYSSCIREYPGILVSCTRSAVNRVFEGWDSICSFEVLDMLDEPRSFQDPPIQERLRSRAASVYHGGDHAGSVCTSLTLSRSECL